MRVQLIKFLVGIVFVLLSGASVLAQDPEIVRHYDYDKNAPLDLKIAGTEKLYEAPHSLNAEARRDRLAFLAEQLKLKPLSPQVIAAIPDLHQPPRPEPPK
jgi:hypothetical protein